MNRFLLAATLSCLACGPAFAADSAVSAPIVALDAALISAMQSGKSMPFIQRYTTLAPVVQRAFDLPEVLQASIGPRWSQLPPKQQADLTTVFKQFTIASYVANFNSFDGEKFTVAPDLRAVGADQVVSTQIVPKSGDSNKLDYVMRQNASGWHAIDVLLDGTISRAAVQRSDFRSLLTGNDAQPLIDSLKKKVAGLSGGVQLPL